MRQVFRDAVNGWEDGEDEDSIVEDLLEIVFKAEQFFEAGDGENAIAVLSGITEGCADGWEEVDNYGADMSSYSIERGLKPFSLPNSPQSDKLNSKHGYQHGVRIYR